MNTKTIQRVCANEKQTNETDSIPIVTHISIRDLKKGTIIVMILCLIGVLLVLFLNAMICFLKREYKRGVNESRDDKLETEQTYEMDEIVEGI